MAYKLLSVRSHSEYELVAKLRHKGLDAEVIGEVILQLREYGMIDDAGFACGYIRRRMNIKPVGRALLARELKQRGIARDIIDLQLTGIDPEAEYNTALAGKKMESWGGEFVYAKISSYLWRKGFDGDIIARVCRSLEDRKAFDSP